MKQSYSQHFGFNKRSKNYLKTFDKGGINFDPDPKSWYQRLYNFLGNDLFDRLTGLDLFENEPAVQPERKPVTPEDERAALIKKNRELNRTIKAVLSYHQGPGTLISNLNKLKEQGIDIYDSVDWINQYPGEYGKDYVRKVVLKTDPKFNEQFEASLKKIPYYKLYDSYVDGADKVLKDILMRQLFIESSGIPDALSGDGALGLTQQLKLGVDEFNRLYKKKYSYDDRLDPEKSIEMQIGLMNHSYNRPWAIGANNKRFGGENQVLKNFYLNQIPKAENGLEYQGPSIVNYLISKGRKYDKAYRKELAKKYGIENYDFSARKNIELLNKLKVDQQFLLNEPEAFKPLSIEEIERIEKQGKTNLPAVKPKIQSHEEIKNLYDKSIQQGINAIRNPTIIDYLQSRNLTSDKVKTPEQKIQPKKDKADSETPTLLQQLGSGTTFSSVGPSYSPEALSAIADMSSTLFNYGKNWLTRKIDLWQGDDTDKTQSEIKIPNRADIEKKMLEQETLFPSVIVGDTIPDPDRGSRFYHLPEYIDLNRVKMGYRNRGSAGSTADDKGNTKMQGLIITPFAKEYGFQGAGSEWTSSPSNDYLGTKTIRKYADSEIVDDRLYGGVDENGRFHLDFGKNLKGKGLYMADFRYEDIFDIAKDKNGNYIYSDATSNKPFAKVPTVRRVDGSTAPLNLLIPLNADRQEETYGKTTGGRLILSTPDFKNKVLVSGSLKNIEEAIDRFKKQHKTNNVRAVILDNGTYSRGLRTFDDLATIDDFKLYEINSQGGAGFYYYDTFDDTDTNTEDNFFSQAVSSGRSTRPNLVPNVKINRVVKTVDVPSENSEIKKYGGQSQNPLLNLYYREVGNSLPKLQGKKGSSQVGIQNELLARQQAQMQGIPFNYDAWLDEQFGKEPTVAKAKYLKSKAKPAQKLNAAQQQRAERAAASLVLGDEEANRRYGKDMESGPAPGNAEPVASPIELALFAPAAGLSLSGLNTGLSIPATIGGRTLPWLTGNNLLASGFAANSTADLINPESDVRKNPNLENVLTTGLGYAGLPFKGAALSLADDAANAGKSSLKRLIPQKGVVIEPPSYSMINDEGYFDRLSHIHDMIDQGLLTKDMTFKDLQYAAATQKRTEDLTKLALNRNATFFRGVEGSVPPGGMGRQNYTGREFNMSEPALGSDISEFENMRRAGVDFSDPYSIAKYQATHVPMQQYGYRSGMSDSKYADALYASAEPNEYGKFQFRMTLPRDYTEGSYKDWYKKYFDPSNTHIDVAQKQLDDGLISMKYEFNPDAPFDRPIRLNPAMHTVVGRKGRRMFDIDESFPFIFKDKLTDDQKAELTKYIQKLTEDFNTGWRGQYKKGGPIVDPRGQWAHPGKHTIVPTSNGRITMQGVPYPVYGQDETGYGQMMQPGGEYEFPGQMVYEIPVMRKGGILPKFQINGQLHFEPSRHYIPPSESTEVINTKIINTKSDLSSLKNRYDRALEFHRNWINSPMYKQMISVNDPAEAANITKLRKENMNDIRWGYIPFNHPAMGGFSRSDTGEITVLPIGMNMDNVFSHELSHSIDRPASNSNFRLIPKKDVLKIREYAAERKKRYGDTYVDPEFERFNYYSNPTEVRARLNTIRQSALENGIYDPFTQQITPEIYKKLKSFDFEPNQKGADPLLQLKYIYTDNQIIDLLNTISMNNSSKGLDYAQSGGQLSYEIPQMKEGGIPERYKNMGFTRVGQKKQGDGKHKWKVLAKKGDQYKVVQGGWRGMQDYKQHGSEERRDRFWDRMGGRNSSKATDPFSPLYWHKRFGTWEQGGEIPQMQPGGQRPTFEQWYKTVPAEKNDTISYNLRRAYQLAPQSQLDAFVSNPFAHLYTAYENPQSGIWEFMKSKNHESLNKELSWFYSNHPSAVEFRKKYTLDKSGEYYKYIPKKKQGGQTRNEREMVNGIADILSQVNDPQNRRQIAQQMINDFNREDVTYDYDKFMRMSNLNFKYGGQMIRRADGSYSQRGLWDNIRANRGSGKKPTKQMLEQERKIKRKN